MRWLQKNFKSVLAVVASTFVLNLISLSLFCNSDGYVSSKWNQDNRVINSKREAKRNVIVLVMTAPSNFDRRLTIRETWGKQLQQNRALVLFVLGTRELPEQTLHEISDEFKTYRDLLILNNLKDSYDKLTEKLLESLTLIQETHSATYLMKCDDDTFINSHLFFEKLKELPASMLYWGYFNGAARIKKSGPWAEPSYHLCDRYLPYARGGGYIISWDLVEFISRNRHVLQVYNSEDVSLGTWLAPLRINRVHDVGFDTESVSRGCLNHHFVSHKQSIEDMRMKHESLISTNKLCKVEKRLKSEYVYNWEAPPSECCLHAKN